MEWLQFNFTAAELVQFHVTNKPIILELNGKLEPQYLIFDIDILADIHTIHIICNHPSKVVV